VNGRPATDYFGGRAVYQASLFEPLLLTGTRDRFDVTVRVVGGGVSGQVGAIRHGIARALLRSDEDLRPTLKRAQLLTRDARVKERKKVGLKRARKAPQYTKR
jgi:small subunit ribosomal protein S9